jgi:hypothetical protein
MKAEYTDNNSKEQIESNILDLKKSKKYASRTKTITREDFLNLNYKYLVINKSNT